MNKFKILLTKEQIQKRVEELGKQISKDYEGKAPILICVLKGAVCFFSDIVRNLSIPISMDFVRFSSYRNATESGDLVLVNDIKSEIEGKDVIVIEDVVDSGKTLSYFIGLLKKRNPASVKICAFLDKPERRACNVNVDYTGFTLNCNFVIGYGLDYAERFRELPYLAEVGSIKDLED